MTPEEMEDHAQRHLSKFGLRLEEIASFIRPLEDHECLALAGSVAEGLANEESDLDLLLVGNSPDIAGLTLREERIEISTIVTPSGLELSIETYDTSEVERLAATMRVLVHCLDDPQSISELPIIYEEADRKFLHRIGTSIPLANGVLLDDHRKALRLERLPDVVALARVMDHFAHREDAVSHAVHGDWESASFALMRSAADIAGALVAGAGLTNHNARWFIELLRRAQPQLDGVNVESVIELMLTRVDEPGSFDRHVALLDELVVALAVRLPNLVPLAERLGSEFQVRLHREPERQDNQPSLEALK